MKILIYCSAFAPAIGGMEKLNETIAAEFVRLGHEVQVITESTGEADLPYPVVRAPRFRQFLRLARQADVIISAPLSLKRILPLFLSRTPMVFSMPDRIGGKPVVAMVKRAIAARYPAIVPSHYMAAHFPGATVIRNPYDTGVFHLPDSAGPRRGFVFVGRFVAWKGCHLLLEAFARIAGNLPGHDLTLVGTGPERERLAERAEALGLSGRVHFAGVLRGDALRECIVRHAVMVVPSIGAEPFGIVALEGLACGCRMVVNDIGGLPEAVGPLAVLAEPGNVDRLAEAMVAAVEMGPPDPEVTARYLADFTPRKVAQRYLEVLARLAAPRAQA